MFKRMKQRRQEREEALQQAEEARQFTYRAAHVWDVAQAVRFAELEGAEPFTWENDEGQVIYAGGGTASASEAEIVTHLGTDWRAMVDHQHEARQGHTGSFAGTLLVQ